jgi:hypothetical protein
MFLPRFIKKRWNEFIERLARENEKALGEKRLDCCNLNGTKIKKIGSG